MSKNLKNYIYNELTQSSSSIKKTIEAFSAYLDEFDMDYKYNYKFLVSHIEDFEKAMKVHNLFKMKCLSIMEELKRDGSINNEFSKILKYNDRLKCNIDFNNILNYSIIETEENQDTWQITGTLKKQYWEKIIENKCVDISLFIEFRYDNNHFSKRYYGIKVSEMEHVKFIKDFFNESYNLIIIKKLGNENFLKLKTLRLLLPECCEMSVVIDDLHSLIVSPTIVDDYIENNLLKERKNANKTPGTFYISLRSKKIKFVKSKLDNFDGIKKELMSFIQEESEYEQR